MCRILLAVGEGQRIVPWIEAFVRASENDPYKEARGKGKSHKDGWGYVLITEDYVKHYKSKKPVFEDEEVDELKKNISGFSVLMAHSRAASQGSVETFNAQPFSFGSPHGYQLYFMHNGDLNKSMLLDALKLPKEKFLDVSDSYVAGMYVSLFVTSQEDEEIVKAISALKEVVNTSLNVGIILASPGRLKVIGVAYMREEFLENKAERDYMRLITFPDFDLFVLASSTLELYTYFPVDEVPNATIFSLEVSLKEKEFEVKKYSF
ncbi:class II glutamine amidotransferase [Pyrococcus woesei]|uniref:class II glutamine amidotransferase n=1 Tax=Pyrococcus woesei TaxID=2262 RepID=UPI003D2F3D55